MSQLEIVPRSGAGAVLADGVGYPALAGKNGELVTSDLHGKYYELAVRGKVFTGSSVAAGFAIPKYDSVTPMFCLWNPSGSGCNFELIKLNLAVSVLGTSVVDSYYLAYTANAGNSISTTAAVVAFAATPTYVHSALIGSGAASVSKFSSVGTNTLLAAPVVWYHLPFSRDLATTGGGAPVMQENFDGTVIVPPSTLITIMATPAATSTTYTCSLTWAEVPII